MKYKDYSRKPPKFKNCNRLSAICDYCDLSFWESQSKYKKKKRHFCSMNCYSQYRKYCLPKEEQHAYKNGGLPLKEKQIRIKARTKLNHAVRDKKIIRLPCEACGEKQSQAHHQDYTKPLAVKWLCARCHWDEHKLIYENPELVEG